jgi:hypothetical protein
MMRMTVRVLAALVITVAPAGVAAQGLGVFVQPTVSRVLANKQTLLEDQSLRGVEAGVTLNRIVELSGTWWQATSSDFQSTRPLTGYSGDVTLLLSSTGVKPYIAGGYGTLRFDDGYLNSAGLRPKNRQFVSLGAGLRVPIGSLLSLDVSARDVLMPSDTARRVIGALRDSTRRSTTHNVQLRAGLRLTLGGRRAKPDPTVIVQQAPPPSRREAPPAAAATAERTANAPRQSTPALPQMVYQIGVPGATSAGAAAPTAMIPGFGPPGVSFPAPVTGEIIVRYGAGGGGSPADRAASQPVADSTVARLRSTLERAMRNLMWPATPSQRAATEAANTSLREFADSVRLHDVNQALRAYVDAFGTMRAQAVMDSLQPTLVAEQVARVRIEARLDSIVTAQRIADSLLAVRNAAVERAGPLVISGVGFGVGTQFVLGTRVDLGPPVKSAPWLRLMTDVGVGVGSVGTVTVVGLLGEARLGRYGRFEPFAEAGSSLVNRSEPTTSHASGLSLSPDLGFGARIRVGSLTDNGHGRLFIVNRGVDLFRLNRLLVGWQLR